jgi:hypothetical protein
LRRCSSGDRQLQLDEAAEWVHKSLKAKSLLTTPAAYLMESAFCDRPATIATWETDLPYVDGVETERYLRKIAERTVAGLMRALQACADIFKSTECTNYFAACGYETT